MRHSFGSLTVYQLPCLQDNYAFVLRDETTKLTAAVDTPDAGVIRDALAEHGWGLDLILNTHWHADHTGGNVALKEEFGATVIGPTLEGDRIPGRDRAVSDGDQVKIGALSAQVIGTPGHTKGHICYYLPQVDVVFVGDTLFSLGCGRLFEGTPSEMWSSLLSLRALPPETAVFCAHEYTQANLAFAKTVMPTTEAFDARGTDIQALRAQGRPTVPTTIGVEAQTNPFLRADDPALASALGLSGAAPTDVFAEVRARKDRF